MLNTKFWLLYGVTWTAKTTAANKKKPESWRQNIKNIFLRPFIFGTTIFGCQNSWFKNHSTLVCIVSGIWYIVRRSQYDRVIYTYISFLCRIFSGKVLELYCTINTSSAKTFPYKSSIKLVFIHSHRWFLLPKTLNQKLFKNIRMQLFNVGKPFSG